MDAKQAMKVSTFEKASAVMMMILGHEIHLSSEQRYTGCLGYIGDGPNNGEISKKGSKRLFSVFLGMRSYPVIYGNYFINNEIRIPS